MDNQLYLIFGEDYINHINEQINMYDLLLTAVNETRELLLEGKVAAVVRTLCKYEQQAHEMFRAWNIPDKYLLGGNPRDLEKLMDIELLPADTPDGEAAAKDCKAVDHILDMANELAESMSRITRVCGKLLDEASAVMDAIEEQCGS